MLTDGNHRAFAAILAGEPFIYVYVLPNHRADVFDRLEGLRREPSLPVLPSGRQTMRCKLPKGHKAPKYPYGHGSGV
jgi:hypothetical protein